MMRLIPQLLSSVLLGATLLWGSPGCFGSTNDPGPAQVSSATGSLTVDWTINNSTDPNQCNQSVATDFNIVVTTPDNVTVGDFVQRCSDGVTTIGLDPGDYSADAALLDSAGAERTTRVNINPFSIHGNTDLSITVDFPASSFQ